MFRASFGKGLALLRKVTVPCGPRGMHSALIVDLPPATSGGGAEEGVRRREVHEEITGYFGMANYTEVMQLFAEYTPYAWQGL